MGRQEDERKAANIAKTRKLERHLTDRVPYQDRDSGGCRWFSGSRLGCWYCYSPASAVPHARGDPSWNLKEGRNQLD
jgi:hypothetical protein